MRCYHLCNFYLAGIHAGIQSAHTQHELAIKYLASTPYRNMTADESMVEYGARLDLHTDAKASYIDWANNHKTMILLSGGMMSHLLEFETFLTENSHAYAWSSFREEEAALNNALTNVGIVLPEHMYAFSRQVLAFADSGDGFDKVYVGIDVGQVDFERKAGTEVITAVHHNFATSKTYTYSAFDIELLRKLAALRLMGA